MIIRAKLLYIIIFSAFLFGCGGESNDSQERTNSAMTLSELYTINSSMADCIDEDASESDLPLDEITFLGCGNDYAFSSIEGLDLLTNLQVIAIEENALSGVINIPCDTITNLVKLNISSGKDITGVNVNECYNLTRLEASGNNISEIDLTNNDKLNYIDLGYNVLRTLELPINSEGYELVLGFTGFDISNIVRKDLVTSLSVHNNQLTNLDLADFTNLVTLHAQHNSLTTIDTTNNSLLQKIVIYNNSIEDVDFSNNLQIDYISIENNPLSSATIAYLDSLSSGGVTVSK